MTLNQLIYTSCKKGITKPSSGFQIYSYDEKFPETGLLDDNGNIHLLDVEKSEKPNGFVLDDTSLALAPREYAFVRINFTKYEFIRRVQQRDYALLESGRTGNLFRHFIICDKHDIQSYPCEYLCPENLRDGLTHDEPVSTDTPGYLPEPKLIRGRNVSIQNTMEFLKEKDRIDVLLKMVYALLNSENGMKRILICDSQENILQWIAAIEYMLPLSMAIEIPFSTYVMKPSTSQHRICGVFPAGTLPSGNTYQTEYCESPGYLEQFYPFDLLKNIIYPAPIDSHFYRFIKSCLTQNTYNNLEKFHQYVLQFENITTDESYVNAYYLNALVRSHNENIDSEVLNGAFVFLSKLDSQNPEKIAAIEKTVQLLEKTQKDNTALILQYINCLLSPSILLTPEQKERIHFQILETIIAGYLDVSIDFDKLKIIAHGIDLVDEFARPDIIKRLNGIFKFTLDKNRYNFLSDIYHKRVIKANNLDILDPKQEMGKNYILLIRESIKQDPKFAQHLIKSILSTYAQEDASYFTEIMVTLDTAITDKTEISKDIWSEYQRNYLNMTESSQEDASSILLKKGKYDEEYALYKCLLSKTVSENEKIVLIKNEYLRMRGNQKYSKQIHNDVENIINSYPLEIPSEKRKNNLQALITLLESSSNKIRDDKTRLQYIGLLFESKKNVSSALVEIEEKLNIKNIIIPETLISEKECTSYFTWIITSTIHKASQEELLALYKFMSFKTSTEKEIFLHIMTKEFYSSLKNKRNTKTIYNYLSFIVNLDDKASKVYAEKSIGDVLSKRDAGHLLEILIKEHPKDVMIHSLIEKYAPAPKQSTSKLGLFGSLFKKK